MAPGPSVPLMVRADGSICIALDYLITYRNGSRMRSAHNDTVAIVLRWRGESLRTKQYGAAFEDAFMSRSKLHFLAFGELDSGDFLLVAICIAVTVLATQRRIQVFDLDADGAPR